MASATMKVEIVSRETIKPSTPTPPNLATFGLSLLDQLLPSLYTHSFLFYPAKRDTNLHLEVKNRCHVLKTSLSKTLSLYYPFAGRIKDHISIDCNDEGATFIETRVNRLLSDVLQNPDPDQFKELLPLGFELPVAIKTGDLLIVQANVFECGGMAIAACLSHKIADGTTYTTFMKVWASIAREANEVVHPELFAGPTLFPPVDDNQLPSNDNLRPFQDKSRKFKRFVFAASKIDALKAKISSASTVEQPTRVEAITALIWKCAMTTSRSIRGTCSTRSLCNLAVNLRKRLSTPLPEYTIGNIVSVIVVEFSEAEIELHSLVLKLRKGLQDLKVNKEELLNAINKMLEMATSGKEIGGVVDTYNFSSWCRMPLYEADFGWGKPLWISFANMEIPNGGGIFVDTREGDGIEAWITLSEDEMAIFEQNEELLSFASVNPNVIEMT